MTAVAPRNAASAPGQGRRAQPRTSREGTARGWVWPLAAVVLGVAGALEPVPTLIALVGGAVIVLAVVAPRMTAGLTAVVVLFVRPLEHLIPIPQVGYMDEALILLCLITMPLRRVIARQPLRDFPGQWWFAGFLVCGLLSALVVQVPIETFMLGAFIVSKGLLFGWAVAQLDWSERHLAVAARVGAVLIVLCLLAGMVNLVARGPWEAVLASDAKASESRSFLPSLIGPFTHPIDFGQFMALSFLAVAAWRASVRRTAFTLALLLATAGAALASARRTAIVSLVAAWLWLQAKVRSAPVLVALLAGLPIAVAVLAAPLAAAFAETYALYLGTGDPATGDPAARTVLTRDSFTVAAAHFPLGAGFGRFGSAVAATTYSPEYLALGYPAIWGLGTTPETGRFLTDTEWPAIIGETGFFGALAFALGLVAAHRAGLRLWRAGRTPLVRWAGLVAVGWLIAGVVQSVGTVTFTGPPTMTLIFGIVGVVGALTADGALRTDADGRADAPPSEPDEPGARAVRR